MGTQRHVSAGICSSGSLVDIICKLRREDGRQNLKELFAVVTRRSRALVSQDGSSGDTKEGTSLQWVFKEKGRDIKAAAAVGRKEET